MNKENTCEHIWVNVQDGSLDQMCSICRIKQKRAAMSASRGITIKAAAPIMVDDRTVTIHGPNGPIVLKLADIERELNDPFRVAIDWGAAAAPMGMEFGRVEPLKVDLAQMEADDYANRVRSQMLGSMSINSSLLGNKGK